MNQFLTKLSLAAAAILLLGSCAKINERIDKLEGRIDGIEKEKIATIDTQIESINSSIADLSTIRKNIQDLTSTTTAQAKEIADLQNEDTEIGKKISDLKKADESINKRIDDLQKYVNDTLKAYATTEWVNATFATLDQYEATCDTIAKIDARLGAMDVRLSKSIEDCADSLKTWVNVQLDGYYTIAEMDAKVAEMNAQLDTLNSTNAAAADSLKAEIATAKADIDSAKVNIRTEYKAAIETAITELEGRFSAALEAQILDVNRVLLYLNGKVTTLETSLDILTGKVEALEGMIQSVVIVPAYSDGSVKVDEDSILYIDCIVSPDTVVNKLTKENVKVLINKVKTKAFAGVDTVKLEATDIVKDETNGTFSINVKIANKIPSAVDSTITVAVNVKNGKSDYTTKFVPVTLPVSVSLDKQSIVVPFSTSIRDTTLNVTVKNSTKGVTWTSSNTDIATVDATGKVTIKENVFGKDTIVVTTVEGAKTDTCVVTVKPTTGTAKATIGGHDVDVNWVQLWADGPYFAEYNVGFTDSKAESYGGYYAWGGSQDKDGVYNIGESALSGESDTATNLWGSNWRMPTTAELEALLSRCDVEWMDGNTKKYKDTNIKGLLCKGKGAYASNSVFLPAAGYCSSGNVHEQSVAGYYWSSTPNGGLSAYYLYFDSNVHEVRSFGRTYVNSVRAVLAE